MFVAAAVAVPVYNFSGAKAAKVIKFNLNNIGVNGYDYAYETSDGKLASEMAVLKNAGLENESLEVRGFFSYLGDDGKVYRVDYVANENGFQPSAPHLPA
ncbi:cuticle protein 1 [Danaus plexippus plexippus]|uniref:Cuticle protein 1 n=2 Tax=Danaus plexippus TaxID=13037 RepID=A0A212EMY2_DANPL|nr:cuticle protein 1 [Danaus plexippus plexippus]OWR54092.1 cuticle protein 1 [Danaus plexippus plexippus]